MKKNCVTAFVIPTCVLFIYELSDAFHHGMAVPPQHAKEIQDFFSALNPYIFDAPLFKVEQKDFWFYGISAKRYTLYQLAKDDNAKKQIKVLEASSHGLGHLRSPYGKNRSIEGTWHEQLWHDILQFHYGLIS